MWEIVIWDYDQKALTVAEEKITQAAYKHGLRARVVVAAGDSFTRAPSFRADSIYVLRTLLGRSSSRTEES